VVSIERSTGTSIGRYPSGSHSQFTTPLKKVLFGSGRLWTVGNGHLGFADTSKGLNLPLHWTGSSRFSLVSMRAALAAAPGQ
jgi:hypothetical protein